MNKHFANVSHETSETVEPIYSVRLLPDVREQIEAYARKHRIPISVAIAEACRAFCGMGE